MSGTSVCPHEWQAIGGGSGAFIFGWLRRFTGVGISGGGAGLTATMVGLRATDLRLDLLLSAPAGLIGFMVNGGAAA